MAASGFSPLFFAFFSGADRKACRSLALADCNLLCILLLLTPGGGKKSQVSGFEIGRMVGRVSKGKKDHDIQLSRSPNV
jgi:hypothetical protein